MGDTEATGEIARMAREVQESVDQFANLDGLLRSTLPRLIDPSQDAEFNAAVSEVTGQLDEMALHQLSMLLNELWLYWNTAEPASPGALTRPPSASVESLTSHDRSVLPHLVEEVVNLASFVSGAAAGGVIGRRADEAVQRMLNGARKRWRDRARSQGPNTPLNKEEAKEVADAVIAVHGDDANDDANDLLSAEFRDDGTWLLRLRTGGKTVTVAVPPGDPGRARVVIRVS